MQIAVVLPDEVVDELDRVVRGRFRSRAEAVRQAVDEWLITQRKAEIDRRYRAAYDEAPQPIDRVDALRVTTESLPAGWEELAW